MSIFTKEIFWTDSTKSVVIQLGLRGKQKKDVDIIQTKDYLKVQPVDHRYSNFQLERGAYLWLRNYFSTNWRYNALIRLILGVVFTILLWTDLQQISLVWWKVHFHWEWSCHRVGEREQTRMDTAWKISIERRIKSLPVQTIFLIANNNSSKSYSLSLLLSNYTHSVTILDQSEKSNAMVAINGNQR